MAFITTFIILFHNALAAEALPGDSCAGMPSGTFRQSSGPEITGGHMLVCDGTSWLSVMSYNADAEVTTIGNQSCGSGEVLAFDGTIWACSVVGGSSIWETTSNVIRPTSGTADYATDDFVFGSYQLADTTNANHDARMFFDKSKGAFRAGVVTGTQWNSGSVGVNSTAFGEQTTASGEGSMAWGDIHNGGFANGSITASGQGSTAFGYSGEDTGITASGTGSTVWGAVFGLSGITASGNGSTAWGTPEYGNTTASGTGSTAFGSNSTATGYASTAWGGYGYNARPGGTAVGVASTAWGLSTHAGSYAETSLGRYSLNAAGTPASWVATDVLFEIGNGANSGSRANAFTVLKNGNITWGKLQSAADSSITATGNGSTAFGYSTTDTAILASGDGSTAWGNPQGLSSIEATGNGSTAWGVPDSGSVVASGVGGTAFGSGTTASGLTSTAWGGDPYDSYPGGTAVGIASTAWGIGSHAGSYAETSHGRYPLNTAGTAGSWVATDVLFEIGNGSSGSRANALTLLKNGNIGIGTAAPESTLHVPDGKYLQAEDNNAGAPPSGDCDADAELGRMSIDTTNNRLYVCMGSSRGWDYSSLTD